VLSGVPELIAEVQVEGTFRTGPSWFTVHHPIALEQGDLSIALYGSFLPAPGRFAFGAAGTSQCPARSSRPKRESS